MSLHKSDLKDIPDDIIETLDALAKDISTTENPPIVIPQGNLLHRPDLPEQGTKPPTIYLIRHGEKLYPSNDPSKINETDAKKAAAIKALQLPAKVLDTSPDEPIGLDNDGKTRAKALPAVFNPNHTNPYNIQFVMAMEVKKKTSQHARPLETIWPLYVSLTQSAKSKVELDHTIDEKATSDAANRIWSFINSGAAGNVIICWEHGMFTEILTYFGITPAPKYPGDLFDVCWELHPQSVEGNKWAYNEIRWSTEATPNDTKSMKASVADWTNNWMTLSGAPKDSKGQLRESVTFKHSGSTSFSWSPAK